MRKVTLAILTFVAFYLSSAPIYATPDPVPAASPIVITRGSIFIEGGSLFLPTQSPLIQRYAGLGFSVNASGYVSLASQTYNDCYSFGCGPGSIVSATSYVPFSTSDPAFRTGTVTVNGKAYPVGMNRVNVGGTYNFVSPSLVFPNVNTPFVTLNFPFRFEGHLVGFADMRSVFNLDLRGQGIATVRFTRNNFGDTTLYRATSTTYNFQPASGSIPNY